MQHRVSERNWDCRSAWIEALPSHGTVVYMRIELRRLAARDNLEGLIWDVLLKKGTFGNRKETTWANLGIVHSGPGSIRGGLTGYGSRLEVHPELWHREISIMSWFRAFFRGTPSLLFWFLQPHRSTLFVRIGKYHLSSGRLEPTNLLDCLESECKCSFFSYFVLLRQYHEALLLGAQLVSLVA